ncbi:phage-like protein [Devosia yakushimensis]|uniref:Phage-like protein n=1 Tax=Devosia yakushimensis TaxID=470028 RepID=A0ABQ5UCM6_9HYPH|nr:hypothetical protein [Devosia yakushimensis]GLQ09216.1 phage-like protein [Devosia yakushimensis]
MADRPMLFSGPMVRALLDGTKTQTRRLCRLPQPTGPIIDMVKVATEAASGRSVYEMKDSTGQHVDIRAGKYFVTPHYMPPVAVGDRLWVRETWTARMTHGWTIADARSGWYPTEILYQADGVKSIDGWWPSIHMPREFSRITLTVTDVRVERLKDCSAADALAEGVVEFFRGPERLGWPAAAPDDAIAAASAYGIVGPVEMYRDLWESINGPGSWAANPWVVAYTFTVQRGNIDQLARAA